MKIRNGFVSNSSSSSFCLLGIERDIDDFQEIFGFDEDCDFFEEFYKMCHHFLDIGFSESFNEYVVGIHVDNIDENLTIAQAKELVKEKLKGIGVEASEDVEFLIGVDSSY